MLSLLRLACKQKNYSNSFRIRIFLFLSYSFGVETINTFIRSRNSLENHARFQTKVGKVYTRFQTKTAKKSPQNLTRWGGTYLYSLCKGVPPSPGSRGKGKPRVTTVKISFSLEKFSAKLHLPIN